MRIAGDNLIPFPVDRVWDALLDPAVLVRTIPGCSRLETTGENAYAMTVTAGVAAIRGTYEGSCALTDLATHESLRMRLSGAGAPGTVEATVDVGFEQVEGGTRVTYEADAVVGGMVGGVGQRMLSSVSRRMAGEFFGNVAAAIGSPAPASTTRHEGSMPLVYTDDARPGLAPGSREDFLKGIAVGAGLVLLGVVAGSLLGRKR